MPTALAGAGVGLGRSASDGEERIARLREAVERTCPILALLRSPQAAAGHVHAS